MKIILYQKAKNNENKEVDDDDDENKEDSKQDTYTRQIYIDIRRIIVYILNSRN